MASKLRNIRVDDEQWARWQAAALDRGYSVSEFIKAAVDARIAEPKSERIVRGRKPVAMAAKETVAAKVEAPEPVAKSTPVDSAPPRVPVAPLDTFRPDFKKGKS